MKDLDVESKVVKMSAQWRSDYTPPVITFSHLFFKALGGRDASKYDICRANKQSYLSE